MSKMQKDLAGERVQVREGREVFANAKIGRFERQVLHASLQDGRLARMSVDIPPASTATLGELRELAATLNAFVDAVEDQVKEAPAPARPQRRALDEVLWTVGRFPSGEWTSGSTPADETYAECEVFQVMASSREQAVRRAQSKRSAAGRKARKAAQEGA